MFFFKKKIKPNYIHLDVSTICQLKCPVCPTAKGEIKENLGAGFLKFEDFKKIVDENPWVTDIELSNWGEIFLNPELGKIIEYAYTKKVRLHAANGVNLNNVSNEVIEKLVKYQFFRLNCSIDGGSKETYPIYRKGGDFERVINNIKKINAIKEKYNSKLPILIWKFIIFGHTYHEVGEAKKMAEKLGMNFITATAWDAKYDDIIAIKEKDKELIKELIKKETGQDKTIDRKEYYKKTGAKFAQKKACLMLWNSPQINFDGKVLGCCVNKWGDFGNAFTEGLLESINNNKLSHAREVLMGKKEPAYNIPCKQCDFYKTMKKNNSWINEDDIKVENKRLKNIEKEALGLKT